MGGVTLRGMVARKLRSLLTAMGIAVGVALVSGSFIMTDTIEKAFAALFTSSYDEVDAVISAPESAGPPGPAASAVADPLLDRIRALPEVEHAAGTLVDLSGDRPPATLLDKGGEPVRGAGPTFAFGVDADDARFSPLELVSGRWPAGSAEVLLDVDTAERHGFALGDPVDVVAKGSSERFTVVGLGRFGDSPTSAAATAALFDVETARELHGVDGYWSIAVAARDGISREQLADAIRPLLPIGVEVRSGEQQAAQASEAVSMVQTVRYFLLAFGAIAVLIGAFVIANAMSITVALRTRELATLRMLGGTRRQVRRSVLLEGAVLGLGASLVGLAAGFVFAEGLRHLFGALGVELPDAPTVFRTRTAVVSVAVGVGVTTLAALVPAVRATRVAPLAAVRDAVTGSGDRRSRRTAGIGWALLGGGAAVVTWRLAAGPGSPGAPDPMVLGAVLLLLTGSVLLASAAVRPVTRWLAGPLITVGGPAAVLARENAARNPARTASTAGALMIGVTLVTFASVFAAALVGSGERAVRAQVSADHIIAAPSGWRSPAEDVGRAAAAAPGVEAAASIRTVPGGTALANGRVLDVSGVDAAMIADLYRFRWTQGSDAAVAGLGSTGALIGDALAREQGLSVGDRIVLTTAAGAPMELDVRGVFERPLPLDSLLGEVVVAQDVFGAAFPPQASALTLVRAADVTVVERLVRDLPHAQLVTPKDVAAAKHSENIAVLRLLYVLLALAVLVSVIGLVNTLVLATVERTRELGMLRAIGMRRRDLRRMVRYESVLTALLGTSLALPLGVACGAAVVQSAGQRGLSPSIPVGTLLVLVALTVMLGAAAAALPARRAARLDVVSALQHE